MDSQNTFSYSIPNCSSVFNSVEDLPAGAVLKDSNNLAPNSTTSIAASVASNLSSNSSNFMQQQPLTSRLSMYNLSGISTAPTSGETSIPSAHGALNTSPLPSPAHSPRPIRRIHQGTGSYSPTSSPVQQRKATAARSPSPNDSRDSSSALPGRPARSTTFNSRIQTNNILGQEALLFNHSFTATKLTHEPILIDNLKLTNGSTELNETVNGRSASSINPTTTSSSFTSNRSLQQASSLDTLNNILPSRTRARAGTTSSISSVSAVSVSKRPQLTREFFLMKNTMDSSAPSTAIDSASSASRLLYSASIESLLASQQSTVAIGTTMMGSGSSIYQFDFKFQNNVVAPSRYVTPAASVDDLLFPPSSGRASTINAVITSCPVLSQQSTASNDLIYDDSSKSSMQKSILLRFLDTLVEADGKRYVMSKNPYPKSRITSGFLMSFIFLIILIIELCVGDGQGHNSTSIGFTSLSVNPFFGPGATTLLRLGANDAILVKRDFSANWWRLIVAGFLHVGVVHWLLNSITMWVVCRRMERWFGFWRVIIMFIFCSFGSQYLSSLARTHEVLSMGASGGICGLLGCIIADNIKNWHMIHLPKVQISYWIFQSLILFAFGFVPCFDNIAHTGGFISGVFIGFLLVPFVDSVVVPLCSSHRRITPTNSNLELQDKTSSLVSSPLNLMIPPSIRQQRQNFVESSFSASVETLVFVEADHQLADKNSNKPSTTPTTTTTITTIIESNPNLFHYIRIMYFFMIISGLALSILFIGGSVAMANHINVSSQSLCFLLWSVSC